ncbi:MAG: LysR family transcriptional regulator [Ottowia sp.]|uniref:LysR family transcriptional regulator n=1 Tax=unclassified Ottowia TaxID=2645081 RepID=UPI003C2C10D3
MNSNVPRSIGRRLRFAQLELVHEVAECGNLAEVAARLHITRAAVSKAIKELERSLGQELFQRSRQGMAPTAAGLRVAKHARLLINELRHLTDEVAAGNSSHGGLLRIGMPPFVAEHVAPAVLRRLLTGAPWVAETVQLHEGRLHAFIEQLLRGEVDAVLSLYSPRAVDNLDLSMLDIRPFLTVPMVVIASPQLGVPEKRHRWADLLGYPWILPSASTHQRKSFNEMFTARGSRAPSPLVESDSLAANVQLVVEGLGLAVVPRQAAESLIAAERLQVVDVRPALPETVVALMYRKVSAIYMEALQQLDQAVSGG